MAALDDIRFRRSRHLVLYWHGRQVVIHNYATGVRFAATPVTLDILRVFTHWQQAAVLFRRMPRLDRASLRRALVTLARHSLLVRSDRDHSSAERLADSWTDWSPAAAFFHLSTKDTPYPADLDAGERWLARYARGTPAPSPVKSYPSRRRVALTPPRLSGDLPQALLARRTWRRFSNDRLDARAFSTLLGLTWRIQDWVRTPSRARVALKTSPSGGACHPIEVYVAARRVAGLAPGLYHYDTATHALHAIKAGCTGRQIQRYTCGQWWYRDAAALFIMTAVFPRAQWRYHYPRAYRSVLLEAGHFCQTFCLVATWLNLAPFCTAALADSRIERDLGIDGITESVVYAAGVGCRPAVKAGESDLLPGQPRAHAD